jgi:ATP-dependent DNA ligase
VNSRYIFDNFIRPIKQAKGLKAKQEKLGSFASHPEFADLQQILVHAYDPMVTFGISAEAFRSAAATLAPRTALADFESKNSAEPNSYQTKVLPLLNTFIAKTYSGNQLKDFIAKTVKDVGMGYSDIDLICLILDKDLKIGLGPSSINKVIPELLFDFGVMLASPFDGDKLEFPAFVEPKYDGMRAIAFIQKGSPIQMLTRSGHEIDIELLPPVLLSEATILADALQPYLGFDWIVLDGEIMGTDFQDTMKNGRKKEGKFDSAKFYVFDALRYSEFYKMQKPSALPYKERRKMLRMAHDAVMDQNVTLTKVVLPQAYLVNSEAEIQNYYEVFRSKGYEGLIVKAAEGRYRQRRHSDWMKMKGFETLDLPTVGVVEGTGKYVGMAGALVVNHKGVHVNVGTGLSDAQRKEIWTDWLGEKKLLGSLVEVGYQELTPDNSLRHPRFIKFRHDKPSINEEAWG